MFGFSIRDSSSKPLVQSGWFSYVKETQRLYRTDLTPSQIQRNFYQLSGVNSQGHLMVQPFHLHFEEQKGKKANKLSQLLAHGLSRSSIYHFDWSLIGLMWSHVHSSCQGGWERNSFSRVYSHPLNNGLSCQEEENKYWVDVCLTYYSSISSFPTVTS